MPQLTYFQVTGTWEPSSTDGTLQGNVSFSMLVENNGVLAAPTLDNPAIVVPTTVRSVISNGTLIPVSLLANTAPLSLVGNLYYQAVFSNVYYNEPHAKPVSITLAPITFAASTDATPINLVNVTPAAGVVAVQLPPSVATALDGGSASTIYGGGTTTIDGGTS